MRTEGFGPWTFGPLECSNCGRRSVPGTWWWTCSTHDVVECDGCSIPPAYGKAYEDGTHRFSCDEMGGPWEFER